MKLGEDGICNRTREPRGAFPTSGGEHGKRRVFAWIVRHRVAFVVLFCIAAVFGVIGKSFVSVNYDMNDYLPAESSSTRALETMQEEFEGDIPSARVMVKDVSLTEALSYKERIESIDGVTSVVWLDDTLSISVPLAMQNQDVVETYYRDGAALFTVSIEEDKRLTAVDEIRALVGDKGALTGSAVSTEVATKSTVSEIALITLFGVLFVLIVLVLTTRSWLEPLLVLAGLGVAVAINSGTNLLFGEISFVTNAAGAILQIAIALDFSVFLLHRYNECRPLASRADDAMVTAMCKSFTAIASSACTVMIGFLALTVMQFQIGPDLGFALAKGIFISLITVFTFVPALFVMCDGGILKTRHRPFVPSMKYFSKWVAKVCIPLACAFVLLPVPAFMASTSEDIAYYYGSSNIFGTDTRLGADTQLIEDTFGKSDTYVLMVPRGNVAQEQALSEKLHDIPEVKDIISYVDLAGSALPSALVDEETLSQIESASYSRMVISVEAAYEGSATFALVDTIRSAAEECYPGEWMLAGEGVSTTDLMGTITKDKDLVDIIAVVAVFVVLLIATRSLALPIILVFVIETSIWCNFAVPFFTQDPVFYLSYLIVSSVQLGVTVDYAILFADRYRECRVSMLKKESLISTVKSVTVPIMTSGVVLVVVGFILSFVSSHGVLSQLGHFLGVGVLLSLLAVLFVLPGFLLIFDGAIGKTTLHAHFLKEPCHSKADRGHSDGSHAAKEPLR